MKVYLSGTARYLRIHVQITWRGLQVLLASIATVFALPELARIVDVLFAFL